MIKVKGDTVLTEEQKDVIETICTNNTNRIITVNSVAGSGKTTTCIEAVKAYKPKTGLITAFNKAITESNRERVGKLIECSTLHSLAYKHVKPKLKIEPMNPLVIEETLSYDSKYAVINGLDDFYRSSFVNVYDYVDKKYTNQETLKELICKYAELMLENKINPTFNFLLKVLHILLHKDEINIDMDFLCLDEAQDTTEVTLEIIKLINAKTKVFFGDKYQNIYSFMNTVNAFKLVDNPIKKYLTQSFRCNPQIAEVVENYGLRYLDRDFIFKGTDSLKIASKPTTAYISRTNTALVELMHDLLSHGRTFTLIRNIDEIFEQPIALLTASTGKPVYSKKYKYFEIEYQRWKQQTLIPNYFTYMNIKSEETIILTKILSNFRNKGINIYSLKTKVKEMTNPDPYTILSTAHTYKGLEADNVILHNDLNFCISGLKEKIELNEPLTISEEENLNTYYVALSRSKIKLNNAIF